jgi:uncharacterized protein YecT (DUF1311 family)
LSFSASAADCGIESSSAQAGCNSRAEFDITEKKLNATYRQLLSRMNKPDWLKARETLIRAERAWLSYRERHCAFDRELVGAASSAPYLDCLTDITQDRASYLSRLLEQFQ